MTAIAYPPNLPGPQPGGFDPRPRRAASSIDGPLQQRARQRDAAGLTSQYAYIYTPEQMAAWLAWYRDTLLDGRRWFAHALPGPGGLMQRVVRYRSVQQQLLGVGIYRVSASFEQRGASMPPATPATPADPFGDDVILLLRNNAATFLDESIVEATPTLVGSPVIDGAGTWSGGALDPAAGHVAFADRAEYDMPTPELVAEIWYRLDPAGAGGSLFGWASSPSVYLDISTTGWMGFGGMGAGVVATDIPSKLGVWRHAAMIWSLNEDAVYRGAIYDHGIAIRSTSSGISGDRNVVGGFIHIGDNQFSTLPFEGLIGEVRITLAKRYTRWFDGANWRIDVPTGPMLPVR